MSDIVRNRRQATQRKSLASVCLTAAKVVDPRAGADRRAAVTASTEPRSVDPMFDYIEAVQRKFGLSEKEMSARLGIVQSNYTRRTYNAARVARLPDDMRQLFGVYFAAGEGLTVHAATPHEQIRRAAVLAIVNLLDYLEAK